LGFFNKFSFNKKREDTDLVFSVAYENNVIYSPLKGKLLPLDEVPDEMFASKTLGDGLAIYPYMGKLYSPVSGKVTALFPTNHAVGMINEAGMEILLHIGIDTVSMNGDGFITHVSNDEEVKVGQLLVEFDITKIIEAGLNPCVMLIVINHQKFGTLVVEKQTEVDCLEKIISFSNG